MKVVYVTATMPYGHGEEFLISEARELIRQDIELIIVPRSYATGCFHEDATLSNIAISKKLLSVHVLVGALLEIISSPLKCLKALMFVFSCNKPKLILYNLAVFPKGLWLSRLATRNKVDHIHSHWASTTATMAYIASMVSGIPWSLTAHRGDIVLKNQLNKKFERTTFVRFISHSGVDLAKSCGVDLTKTKYEIIHMGVQLPETFNINRVLSEIPIILCPASLLPVKGHKYLLQAMSILRDRQICCRLLLAGEGFLFDELSEEVNRSGIDDMVSFLGQVPHKNITDMYREHKADLVVLPSLDLGNGLHEGIPVALIEAMGFGIPVISTMTGGIPELLHERAGILVPPGDSSAIANAIQSIIENNDLRNELIYNGRSRVEKEYSVQSVVTKIIKNIEQCSNINYQG